MEKGITFVGLDAHKEMNSVAMLLPGQTVAVVGYPERACGGEATGAEAGA